MVDQADPGRVDPVRQKLLAEHGRLLARIEELEHELSITKRSRSWKITFPLRMIRPMLGYLRSLFIRARHELLVDERGMASSSAGRLPTGWAYLSSKSPVRDNRALAVCLYFDEGEGIREYRKEVVPLGSKPMLLQFPRLLRELRIDAVGGASVPAIEVREVRTLPTILSLARERGVSFSALVSLYLRGGLCRVWLALLGRNLPQRLKDSWYDSWVIPFDTFSEAKRSELQKAWEGKEKLPLLSVLMPTYNTEERWLRRAIESVRNQTYPAWELCIADDASHRPSVRKVLEQYQATDPRIRVSFLTENGHISVSSNAALEMAKGQYIALMDHDDELHPCALAEVGKVLIDNPELRIVFTDEDRLTEEHRRIDPYCKAGLDRELMLTRNCISHLGVYKTELARSIGGFRRGYEGSQDWDFALRAIENVSDTEVCHIPKVLYHWRITPTAVSFSTATKADAFSAGERAVHDHLVRTGVRGAPRKLSSGGIRIEYPEPREGELIVTGLPVGFNVGSAKVVVVAPAALIESNLEALRNLARPLLAGRAEVVVGSSSQALANESLFVDSASRRHSCKRYEKLFDRGASLSLRSAQEASGTAVAILVSAFPEWRKHLAGNDVTVVINEIQRNAAALNLRSLAAPFL